MPQSKVRHRSFRFSPALNREVVVAFRPKEGKTALLVFALRDRDFIYHQIGRIKQMTA